MKKTIWIINEYASTPHTGMGGRHFYLAKELAKQGCKVYLIASSPHHLLRQPPSFDGGYKFENTGDFTFVWVKVGGYSEAHSLKRVINWFRFPLSIQKLRKILPSKPDAILASSPSPFVFLGAHRLARKTQARLVFEVRDIWPLTLIELGGHSKNHPFIRMMQWVEDFAYKKADAVTSNLYHAKEHMVSRGLEPGKFTWIPNGFSIDEVNNNEPIPHEVKQLLPKNKFIIGYTGTIGVANALHVLIEAAEIVRNQSTISFVIVGDGKEKQNLMNSVLKKGLMNVMFLDPIPKVQVQSMLQNFDACYIGWLDESIYRFGIGANKIPEYLVSGKPTIHSFSGPSDPFKKAGAGLTVRAEDPHALADAIIKISEMASTERLAYGENGKKEALNQYEYGPIATRLKKVLIPND